MALIMIIGSFHVRNGRSSSPLPSPSPSLLLLLVLFFCSIFMQFAFGIRLDRIKSMYLMPFYTTSASAATSLTFVEHELDSDDPFTADETMPYETSTYNLMSHMEDRISSSSQRAMNRIFGGNEAGPNSFAYQVGILLQRPKGLYWCGGSVITRLFILTAAHCVDMASRALIFLGAHDIKNVNESGQIRVMVYPKNFIIFPTWNPRKLKDDIALVRLPKPISFNDRIQPIELPENDYEYKNFEGKLAIASGWGRYASGVHAISNVLRYVKLRITNGKVCKKSFPFSYRTTNICTSGAKRKSTCNGDSGGPLVLQRKNSKTRVLVGITSFGSILGCDRGYPAAFTKVASYLDWISDETDIDAEEDAANAIYFNRNMNAFEDSNESSQSYDFSGMDTISANANAVQNSLRRYPDAALLDTAAVLGKQIQYQRLRQHPHNNNNYKIFIF